jgi:2-oxoglutarate dehydrogenase E2 component (dihydrolipoamide succinyltransferase)
VAEPAVTGAVDVRMPQMGETVTEGTITAWLKAAGDPIAVDEPLLEISTDKVDSEIPSPVAGVVAELLVPEGDTVPIGELIARITTDGPPAPTEDEPPRTEEILPVSSDTNTPPPPATLRSGAEQLDDRSTTATPAERQRSKVTTAEQLQDRSTTATPAERQRSNVTTAEQLDQRSTTATPAERQRSKVTTAEQLQDRSTATPAERQRSTVTFLSPAVRKLVDEHGVDPGAIVGSGRDGRVTRDDVLAVVAAHPPTAERPGVRHVPFTAIRRTIGRNLTASLATAAHTLVVVEVDYAGVEPVKQATGLTWLPFIARAAIDALAEFPLVNAHVTPEGLDVHEDVHLGIAVDLDFEGLVVPVERGAQRLRLPALAEALAARAKAARDHTLAADDYAGGTFTLTNAGRYGTLFTAPIINQPQAAILSTDGVKVRPVAVPLVDGGHGLGFHPVGNLALSFDHRAFDGAYASAFVARVRDTLEQRDWEDEAR